MGEHSVSDWATIISNYAAFRPASYVERPYVLIAALAWFIAACIATFGIVSKRFKPGAMKLIALMGIAIGGFSRTFFVIGRGEIPLDGVVTAVSVAIYAVVELYTRLHVGESKRDRDSID